MLVKDLTGAYKPEYITLNLKSGKEYFVKAKLKNKEVLKATLESNKIARKSGNKSNKKGGFYLVDITHDAKESSKAKSKILKKKILNFTAEELKEDEFKFKDAIASSYAEYKKGGATVTTSVNNIESTNIAILSKTDVSTKTSSDLSQMSIEQLNEAKKAAIESENYLLADSINKQILVKKEEEKNSIVSVDSTATDTAVLENTISLNNLTNKREVALNEILKGNTIVKKTSNSNSSNTVTTTTQLGEIVSGKTKIKKSEANKNADGVKYRRSSLYTLMIKNDGREHSNMIKNTFGNFELPEKFNDHNIGPYLIDIEQGVKDQSHNISEYLSTNDIAKQMVSKWFNRSPEGGFNMGLIAERGTYSATDLDVKLAKNKERGMSVIEDAGEELIKNTFIIVNDYKFTNKEEVAKKAGGLLKIVAKVASYAGYSDVANVATLTNAGISVVGKGYVIKTTAYLYRLVWNEETAATFYNDYWTEDGAIDLEKKEAFEKSDIFKLELIGSQSAWADLQSTIFTKKSDDGLIEIATVKATDKSIVKLQKKFEDFRTKSPLLSGEPIAAKIGLKEGVEKGDKFEVLEQVINKEGKTEYKRVGVIKVDKNHIWDNRYMADEENGESEIKYTTFSGAKNKYYSGMLIRQIN